MSTREHVEIKHVSDKGQGTIYIDVGNIFVR